MSGFESVVIKRNGYTHPSADSVDIDLNPEGAISKYS
jgi:hypothetical protein